MIRERSPTTAGLEYARQHPNVYVDRAVRDAGLVPRALQLGDRRRGDRRERHVAEALLTRLSRSSSSSIVRGEHRIRLASR